MSEGVQSCKLPFQTTNQIGVGERAILNNYYNARDLNNKVIANVDGVGTYVINKPFDDLAISSGFITINFPEDFKLLK